MWKVTKLISRRIIDRLGLDTIFREDVIVPSAIYLVHEISEFLKSAELDRTSKDLSGTGNVAYWTVPDGKLWTIRHIWRSVTTGITNIVVIRDNTIVPLTSGSSSAQTYTNLLKLKERDQIALVATGDAADTSIPAAIIYEEEDAF